MTELTPRPLTFAQLQAAVAGPAAAIRLRTRLEPDGGPDGKVFPPTYAGGVYAMEPRRNGGAKCDVVLLDSVQSQANRLELALLQAYDDGDLEFPMMWVKFPPALVPGGRITALEAPHRIADAIFRESTLKGVPFRPQAKAGGARDKGKSSPEGERFASANVRNATPLFELCPTALIFGVWDSTGAAGGLGNKFARALVSEIVGLEAVPGVRTSSRIDPTAIVKVDLYEDKDGNWTADPAQAKRETDKDGKVVKDKDGNEVLVRFKRKKADKGKPSEINLGNVTPDLARYDDNANTPDVLKREEKSAGVTVRKGEIAPGGVTISHALQTTVLSLPGLRRLRFPDDSGVATAERNNAARTVLAALALAAVVYQRASQGYDLRSRCNLIPADDELVFEIVTTANHVELFTLQPKQAAEIFQQAVKAAKAAKLPWREEPLELQPKPSLVDLVQRSRELGDTSEES
jgi:CRISPR-associated protein Csb1